MRTRLSSLCKIYAGGDAPSNTSLVKTDEKQIPIYSNGVTDEGLYGYTEKAKITEPAVTLSARGTIGVAFKRTTPYVPIVRLLSLIPNDVDVLSLDYLYYSLKMLKFEKDGSVQQQLTAPMISNYSIELKPINEQIKITTILSALDCKISLNRRMNTTLEAMAKQLYDYWFVQFDFPNAEGKPYKSSGGKMVWNEKLKREIPEGWEVKTINELCESNRGVTYDKTDLVTKDEGILILRGNNIQGNSLVYDSNVAYVPISLVSESQKIKKNDIVMTMSSGSKEHIGKCMMFQYDSKDSYGAFLNKFTPYDFPHLIFLFLISEYCKAKIKSICVGTGINNLTGQTFDDIKLALPNPIICNKFEELVKPLYEKIGINENECWKLESLRDFLLPLLMNGQVTVK